MIEQRAELVRHKVQQVVKRQEPRHKFFQHPAHHHYPSVPTKIDVDEHLHTRQAQNLVSPDPKGKHGSRQLRTGEAQGLAALINELRNERLNSIFNDHGGPAQDSKNILHGTYERIKQIIIITVGVDLGVLEQAIGLEVRKQARHGVLLVSVDALGAEPQDAGRVVTGRGRGRS